MAASGMLCNTWLLDRSYILCDREAPGFPIRYASSGFAELFETTPVECQGKKCGAMVGIESVQANETSLATLAEGCSLSPSDVKAALDILHESSSFEVQRMLSTGTGSFVTVNQTRRKGELLVVCVFMQTLCHRASGRGYTIGMQCDFTDEVTIQDVLIAALQGELVAEERRRSFQSCCSQLLGRPDVAEFLDLTIGGSWWPSAATDLKTLGQKTIRKELAAKPDAFTARRKNTAPGLRLPQEAEVDCLQKLALAGLAAGPVIARSRRNRSTRVLQSLRGSREFAVKVVDACEGENAFERLRDEYKILQRIAHPNIVQVADFLVAHGSCAMVMDYIPGQALSQAVGALRKDESYHIAKKVLGALAYLHDDHQVAHRDLKMDNIMVGTEALDQEAGLVKIIDFCNARQDVHEQLQGSVRDFLSSKQSVSTAAQDNDGDVDVRILPPEHPGGRECDFNLDVFAFGLVFAGLLVQREVFAGDVFDGARVIAPLPEVDPAVRRYVTFVLTPGLMPRRKTRAAFHDLPPPHTWFTN